MTGPLKWRQSDSSLQCDQFASGADN